MPELPEVETVARGLSRALAGRTLVAARANRADLRRPLPVDLGQRLVGRRVLSVDRRAKYIVMRLDGPDVLVAHLGMSGRFVIHPPGTEATGRHDHVVLTADDGQVFVFNDARRFGVIDIVPATGLPAYPAFRLLGPEPLEPGFTPAVLEAALAGRRTPIKAALLDQRVVAGIGNIYASEALFRARISPRRLAATVTGQRAQRLVAAIRAVLKDAIEAGGSSLRDYVDAAGELGYFQHRFAVYDREGRPCPGCDCAAGGVRRIVQAGRSSFYCPTRQR